MPPSFCSEYVLACARGQGCPWIATGEITSTCILDATLTLPTPQGDVHDAAEDAILSMRLYHRAREVFRDESWPNLDFT